ncbi:MAG TPA: rhomboid family intramembrane serine protease [Thermoplasmata archaeon]|nr:rhomboid family intramembrane serine protease [Thermoplasmata archaeon]
MALEFVSQLYLVALAVIVLAVAYAFWRHALLSLTLSVAILVVFALQVLSEDVILLDLALIEVRGALSAPWTWVSFQFLHSGPTHLMLNLLAMLLIAPVFEERVGSVRFAVLFFVGGAVGAAGFILLNLAQFGIVLVGASAGISAILGAYGRLYPRDRVALFLPLPGVPSLPVLEVVIGFLVLETALSLLPSFGVAFGSNVAWEAHVIAAIFGFVAAPLAMRIPAGKVRVRRPTPVSGLRDLATTAELTSILEEADGADIPELREAWIEKFVAKARCPECGGALRLRFGRLTSECGWKRRIG